MHMQWLYHNTFCGTTIAHILIHLHISLIEIAIKAMIEIHLILATIFIFHYIHNINTTSHHVLCKIMRWKHKCCRIKTCNSNTCATTKEVYCRFQAIWFNQHFPSAIDKITANVTNLLPPLFVFDSKCHDKCPWASKWLVLVTLLYKNCALVNSWLHTKDNCSARFTVLWLLGMCLCNSCGWWPGKNIMMNAMGVIRTIYFILGDLEQYCILNSIHLHLNGMFSCL
jgi:hypothetical protein